MTKLPVTVGVPVPSKFPVTVYTGNGEDTRNGSGTGNGEVTRNGSGTGNGEVTRNGSGTGNG